MRRVLALAIFLVLFIVTPGKAQDLVQIASLRVDIWPEFDRPAVLVIYHITLADSTPLPSILQLHIPKQAVVNAVAVEDQSVGLLLADYTRVVVGDWAEISITATTPSIQVEYYDVFEKDGIYRQVVYQWLGDAPVDMFNIVFQIPVGAVNVTLVPAPATTQRDQYNLLNYVSDTVSLAQGEVFSFSASYEKVDDELSIASLPVESAIPLDDTSGQLTWSNVLPWILGGSGFILIVLGLLVLFGFKGRSSTLRKTKNQSRLTHNSTKRTKDEKQLDPPAYCNECGHRVEPGDQFCRSCGNRLLQVE